MTDDEMIDALAWYLLGLSKPSGGIVVYKGKLIEFPTTSTGVSKPTPSEIVQIKSDYDNSIQTEKTNRRNRKRALLTKIGMSKGDIKSLLELIKDGNDE